MITIILQLLSLAALIIAFNFSRKNEYREAYLSVSVAYIFNCLASILS